MRTRTKVWLMIAASLVLIGCVLFGGLMKVLQWDFTKLSTVQYETTEHEITENYKNISIVTDTADIVFLPSENAKTSVVCYDQKNMTHSVAVRDHTLVVENHDTRKWYEYIGIHFGTPQITVHIPQGEYGTLLVQSSTGDVEIPKIFKFENIDISETTGNVKNCASASESIIISTTTGNIHVADISASVLDLSVTTGGINVSKAACENDMKVCVSTGKTNLTDVTCRNLSASGDTGDLTLTNVIAAGKLSVERSTGDVRLEKCDAAEIFVETDTGDVLGTVLSEKVFITETSTGRISVPKTTSGGKCEIITSTGDIDMRLCQK